MGLKGYICDICDSDLTERDLLDGMPAHGLSISTKSRGGEGDETQTREVDADLCSDCFLRVLEASGVKLPAEATYTTRRRRTRRVRV